MKLRRKIAFLTELGTALHSHGMPAHRLEEALERVADRLELRAQFLVTPTSILTTIGPIGEQQVAMVRVKPGQVNLRRLTGLHVLIGAMLEGRLSPEDGALQLKELLAAPAREPALVRVCAASLASASAAVLLGGGTTELAVAAGLGVLLGSLSEVAGRAVHFARAYVAVSALLASVISNALPAWGIDVFPSVPLVGALIMLLPGLTLTIAMHELSQDHLVSGAARLMAAIMTFLQLGFGIAVGERIAGRLVGRVPLVEPVALPEWTLLVALLVAAVALTVVFHGRWRDSFIILAAVIVAFFGSRWGSELLGPEVGFAAGSWSLGVLSNALARWRRIPAATSLVPGLIIVVPGGMGLQSVSALLSNDVEIGVATAFAVALAATSLVLGLFLANLTVPPRPARQAWANV